MVCPAVPCSAVPCNTVPCRAVPCRAIQNNAMQLCNACAYNIIQCVTHRLYTIRGTRVGLSLAHTPIQGAELSPTPTVASPSRRKTGAGQKEGSPPVQRGEELGMADNGAR
eukprot:4691462-Heterocapsa_arctica.AAC.1